MVQRRAVRRKVRRGSFIERLREAAEEAGRILSPSEAEALNSHYELLKRWGGRMNLTGLRDEGAILRRHFLEPIAAAELIGDSGRLVDLGSGNGFPAIPLKVLRPGIDLVLVEASEKKSGFLWTVLQALDLKGSRVVTRRVGGVGDLEDLLPCRYLTIRAVRVPDLLGGSKRRILESGGRALFFVSAEESELLEKKPPAGLRFESIRPLASEPRSVLAVFGPE
jgi:16S rRNA (guanine(527)-N(7))-methyltransferase RsmG